MSEETKESQINNTIDVPDIPLPTEAKVQTIKDTFDGAIQFAIIGAGQGGSRIAETFWKLGYRRVAIINTSVQDMAAIQIPETNKMLLKGGGAGKDMKVAEDLIKEHYEDILDFLRRTFKTGYHRILICIGAGGGTGAGTLKTLTKVADDLNVSLGINKKKVGTLVALPTNAEGSRVALNSLKTTEFVFNNKDITPVIILDNQRIKDIYPGLSVNAFWSTANKSICSLFHLFNVVSSRESSYTSFDRKDYEGLLDSGVLLFGATPLTKWKDATDVSYAIRDNLKKNILAGGMDLHKGKIAGCIVIGGAKVLNEIPQENLEHGFEQLSRILADNSVIHRGIYEGSKEGIVVYTAVGGLGKPVQRLTELKNIAGIEEQIVEDDDIYKE